MIEFVKIEKDGVVKTVEKKLLAEYITAGWKEKKINTLNNSASTSFYNTINTK